MITYSDLRNAYSKALDKFNAYHAACEPLAVEIWNELQTYHGIPHEQLELYVFNEEGEPEKFTGPLNSALRLQEDSYLEIGIGIILFVKPDELPYETLILPVRVSQDSDGRFHAKAGAEGKDFIIDRNDPHAVRPFTEHLLGRVIAQYETALQHIINLNTLRTIGFKIS